MKGKHKSMARFARLLTCFTLSPMKLLQRIEKHQWAAIAARQREKRLALRGKMTVTRGGDLAATALLPPLR